MTQILITAEGYKKKSHEIAINCSMFNFKNGFQRCELGYANKGLYPIIPLERCPKPKTREQVRICKEYQNRGILDLSIM